MKLKSKFKIILGRAAEMLFPSVARELEQGVNAKSNDRLKKLILYSRNQRAVRAGDVRIGESTLKQYWQTESAGDFYDRYQSRFDDWFLGPHSEMIDWINQYAMDQPIEHLIELGCGDGQVLNYLAGQLPETHHFTGLDINQAIIAKNQERYGGNIKLNFVAGDAAEWLPQNAGSSALLLTYGGVLEYFSKDSLQKLISCHSKQPENALALVEPLDPEHDLNADLDSRVFGAENSFSHNYPRLLEQAGFRIRHRSEVQIGKIRWIMILAENKAR